MKVNTLCKVIGYWIKIQKCEQKRAIVQCYNYQCNLVLDDTPCWATKIRNILIELGFENAWQNQHEIDLALFYTEFRARVREVDIFEWNENMMSFGTLRLYRTIKTDFGLENYLKLGLSLTNVNLLARLRGGLLCIRVNEGRWCGQNYEDRLCTFCNSQQIEDEQHMFFECRAWSSQRNYYLNRYEQFRARDFVNIFNSGKNLLLDICNFIRSVLEMRTEITELL